jgi:uncharacterized protein YchJ
MQDRTVATGQPHVHGPDCNHDHEPHGHVHGPHCNHDHGHHHHHHGVTLVRGAPKVGRNEPCPCGSGKKHKKCCLE